MLQLIPQSWLSWNFDVLGDDGAVAQIKTSSWPESGTFSIDEATFRACREGVFSGEYILEQNGQPIARAQKPSAFLSAFVVEYQDRNYTLKKESLIGRSFVLLENDIPAGSIQPEGFLTRKVAAGLPDDMPMPVKVFILWLAILLWRREANAQAMAAST